MCKTDSLLLSEQRRQWGDPPDCSLFFSYVNKSPASILRWWRLFWTSVTVIKPDSAGWWRPDSPSREIFKYFSFWFGSSCFLSSFSWNALILAETSFLKLDLLGGSNCKRFWGSSKPYCLARFLKWINQVLLFDVELARRYYTIAYILVSGLIQTE